METIQTTRTFKNGNSQAVRLPKEFAVPDGELFIRKISGVILLIPQNDPWSLFEESLSGFSNDFMINDRNQPEMQKRSVEFDE